MNLSSFTAVPAYGRDYKSAKAVKEDWEAGKDFMLTGMASGYINKEDAQRHNAPPVYVRYKRMTQVVKVFNGAQ